MSRYVTRYGYKTFVKVPGGELQYGHLTGRVVLWFRRRRYTIVPAWKV